MKPLPDLPQSPQPTYREVAECEFAADLRAVPLVLEGLKEYFTIRGLGPAHWEEWQLAAAEGLNNAVQHGCAGLVGARVAVKWGWQGEMIWLEITDPSDYSPYHAQPELPEDILSESGRGSYIMANLCQHIEHDQTPQGHRLTLEKRVGPPAWMPAEVPEMEGMIKALGEEVSNRYEDLSALFSFAEELATSTSFAHFLERSMARLLGLVSGRAAYVRLLAPADQSLRLMEAHSAELEWVPPLLPADLDCVERQVFASGEQLTVEDCRALPSGDPLHRHEGRAYICPVFFQSTPLGCLVITREREQHFTAGELGIARVVADFLGIVWTTSALQEQQQARQRARRELEIAASIQQSLLPRVFPRNGDFTVYGVCHSAQEVGGDYFDAKLLPDGSLLLVIADVMGKGVPAALLATILRAAIHARLDQAAQPDVLMTSVNRQVTSDLGALEMFITAQIAHFKPDGTLLVANAGHCPLVHWTRAGGETRQLHGSGIPLGLVDGYVYQAERFTVAPGDRLVFLTDGLYEVEGAAGRMLGVDAFAEAIATWHADDPAAFCARLLEFVDEYCGKQAPSDDRTLIIVDYRPATLPPP